MLLAISFACKKRNEYPIIPSIKYDRHDTSFGLDSLGNQAKLLNLFITFEDGDGDLGIEGLFAANDTSKIYMTLYKKENNIYTEIDPNDTLAFRIPYIEPQGQNKLLKGEIKIKLSYPTVSFPHDTIKYDLYLIDRAFHKSNTITTPDIVF